MIQIPIKCLGILLLGILPTMASPVDTTLLKNLSVAHLEQQLAHIDSELKQLAHYSLRSGIGPVGYRSKTHLQSTHTEWIRIELGQQTPLDQIVLVPTIWRDTKEGFKDDGFPLEFGIYAGKIGDPNGTLIASYGVKDHLQPRIAPVIVPCPGTIAAWVRIEATALSPRAWDGKFILQLDEILVFNGQENVALNRPIQASSPDRPEVLARKLHFLVDGFVPYLMNASQGAQSIAFVCHINAGDQAALTIDLETVQPLNRIHLHATDLDDTVPMSTPVGFGIPKRLLVEGATRSDFSDAVRLVDYRMETVYETGPIIIRHFPETPCRYVRLIAAEPFTQALGEQQRLSMGFAEIELFSKGRNVALGKSAQLLSATNWTDRSIAALTDGRNLYGQILPIRAWLNELARRHDLEAKRPIVAAKLSLRYARQKSHLTIMSWLAALLAAGIVFTMQVEHIMRMRQVTRIKERFAADLHDELGANLHTIGLLGDLAKEAVDSPSELIELLDRARVFTERSAAAARYCTNMLEAKGLCEDLVEEMKRAASRLLADLEYDLSFAGEDILHRLKPRKRIDLFFFYKECLTNIIRHSGATHVSARLTADLKIIRLTVTDNGHGMKASPNHRVPASLRRRARLLGAHVSTECPENQGTCILLTLKTRKFGVLT